MKAAVYLRISSDPGSAARCDPQREDCEELCQAKGWTPVEYVDNDMSRRNGKPGRHIERMLTDIRDGRSAPSSPGIWTGCTAARSSSSVHGAGRRQAPGVGDGVR